MYFEDWELGMEWELAEVEVTQEEMLEYANKYDIAPIHTDFEYGAKSRFGQIIAPGTYSGMKLWCRWLEYRVPGEEFLAGTQCTMDWFLPVFAGDRLHGKAVVEEKEAHNVHNGFILVNVYGYNQKGEHVLTTHNHIVLKCKAALDSDAIKEHLKSAGDVNADIDNMTENELIDMIKSRGENIDSFIKKRKKK